MSARVRFALVCILITIAIIDYVAFFAYTYKMGWGEAILVGWWFFPPWFICLFGVFYLLGSDNDKSSG